MQFIKNLLNKYIIAVVAFFMFASITHAWVNYSPSATISEGSITGTHLLDGTVTGADIATNTSVTVHKLTVSFLNATSTGTASTISGTLNVGTLESAGTINAVTTVSSGAYNVHNSQGIYKSSLLNGRITFDTISGSNALSLELSSGYSSRTGGIINLNLDSQAQFTIGNGAYTFASTTATTTMKHDLKFAEVGEGIEFQDGTRLTSGNFNVTIESKSGTCGAGTDCGDSINYLGSGKLTGGGFIASSTNAMPLQGSWPYDDNTWAISARNTAGAPVNYMVYAICTNN